MHHVIKTFTTQAVFWCAVIDFILAFLCTQTSAGRPVWTREWDVSTSSSGLQGSSSTHASIGSDLSVVTTSTAVLTQAASDRVEQLLGTTVAAHADLLGAQSCVVVDARGLAGACYVAQVGCVVAKSGVSGCQVA